MSLVSDCCGALTSNPSDEDAICLKCKEHCEEWDDEEIIKGANIGHADHLDPGNDV